MAVSYMIGTITGAIENSRNGLFTPETAIEHIELAINKFDQQRREITK